MIVGTVAETENQDVVFMMLSSIEQLKTISNWPSVKEGISHNTSPNGKANRIGSGSLVVKYRMFNRMYEKDDNFLVGYIIQGIIILLVNKNFETRL